MSKSGSGIQSNELGKTFGRKEYNVIEGEDKKSFYILTALIFVALLSLSLAKSSLDYLDVTMNSPFTSWLTVEMSNASNYDKYDKVDRTFEEWVREERFGIDSKTGTYKSLWNVYPSEGGNLKSAFTRTFSYYDDSLLLAGILDERNVIEQYTEREWPGRREMKNGVIITKSFLDELGFDLSDIDNSADSIRPSLFVEYNFAFSLKLLAVVQSLPQQGELLCEHTLLKGIEGGITDKSTSLRVFNTDETNLIDLYFYSDEPVEDDFVQAFSEELSALAILADNEIVSLDIIEEEKSLGFNYRIKVILNEKYSDVLGLFKELNRKLRNFESFEKYKISNCILDIKESYVSPIKNIHKDRSKFVGREFSSLSVKFNSLDSIEAFQNSLESRHQVELDMDQIISKKNFNVISLISKLLVFVIVLLSVFAVTFYLYNMLRSHLEKIKSNLGTILAFGVSKKYLQKVYMVIVFKLLSKAILWTMISLTIIQMLFNFLPLDDGSVVKSIMSYYSLWSNWWIYGAVFILACVTYFFFRRILVNFLSVSPGDLIYNR